MITLLRRAVVCVLLFGPAALATFRRAARRANFEPLVEFQPPAA